MGRRVVSGSCHPAERKNGDFATLQRLSPDRESWMEVGRVSGASSLGPRSRGGSSSHLVRSQEVWRTRALIVPSRSKSRKVAVFSAPSGDNHRR
ncbi:unnamed protein product [Spirodela intermedia]|uniref:Uncharacterized protein n=1 Tax=Spirodela intermedia TaxID=51605 RepID=A0ABN7EA68_SPIIN|nr:unnamed protein product [Spirodela intermedia]